MLQQTSLLAFEEVKPKISNRQAAVLAVIKAHGPINNRQLAEQLGWPINCVTPRVLELREKAKVRLAHWDVDPAVGRRVNYWCVVETR